MVAHFIFNLSRVAKRVVSLVCDFIFVFIAYWGAYLTRLDDFHQLMNDPIHTFSFLVIAIATLFLFTQMGLYRAILRYMNTKALITILMGCGFSAIFLIFTSYYFNTLLPRSVPVIYYAYLIFLFGGSRFFARKLVKFIENTKKENVIIYGAGVAGRELALLLDKGSEYNPVCFIDDNEEYFNHTVQGLRVNHSREIEKCINKGKAKKILLAIPSVKRARRKEILASLVSLNIEVLTVPNLKEVLNGKINLDSLRDVEVSELLGREPVILDHELMSTNIYQKVVMVTGAGGSIGSELCHQIIVLNPSVLILFEFSEFNLYQIERKLHQYQTKHASSTKIIPLLGSVQSFERLSKTMKSFNVQTVFHAAAFKHVPLVEFNIVEGVRNNLFGTYYAAKAAINAKVESFVLISTDKAVRPTNVMGTTKRLAELALQAFANGASQSANTCFSMVRFGNVLGSSGSVIPLFKKQIKAGGPVTVTHPEITRYFMTIPEAAQLVIQAGAMAKGGEVFVLDMGEPIKINDLAINLIKLSGLEVKTHLNPSGDISIEYSGLRPGEKLYEELLISDDVLGIGHERILMAKENYLPLSDFDALLEKIDFACCKDDHDSLIKILLNTPTEFTPTDAISDLLWNQKNQRHFTEPTGSLDKSASALAK